MFGTLRLILALMVVATHVVHIGHIGQFAVFAFYSLSGYLMTFVLQNAYGYNRQGVYRFWSNRCLRLLPSYWFSIFITILLILYIGEDYVSSFNAAMRLPETPGSWLENIFIAFLSITPANVTPRLSGPTWAITVELFFYLLISIGISKNFKMTILWFAISLLYHLLSMTLGWGYASHYFSMPAASLPFAAGALIYYLKDSPSCWTTIFARYRSVSLALYLASIILYIGIYSSHNTTAVSHKSILLDIEFYLSFFLIWCYLLGCAASGQGMPMITRKQDNFLGAYSYPFYLLHYQAWILGSYIFVNQRPRTTLAAVFVLLIILSSFTIFCIEKPIEKIRTRIRKRSPALPSQAQSSGK